jgi:hypothetical protein
MSWKPPHAHLPGKVAEQKIQSGKICTTSSTSKKNATQNLSEVAIPFKYQDMQV